MEAFSLSSGSLTGRTRPRAIVSIVSGSNLQQLVFQDPRNLCSLHVLHVLQNGSEWHDSQFTSIYINLLINFMSASRLLASSCYCSVVTGIGVVFVALSTRDDVPVLLSMSICTIVCALFVVVDIVCCGPSH